MRNRTSEEYKKAILRKVATTTMSQRQFAIEEGIVFATLHKLETKYQIDTSYHSAAKPAQSDDWSPEQKFALVLESALLSEIEVGEYCRRKVSGAPGTDCAVNAFSADEFSAVCDSLCHSYSNSIGV